MKLKQNFWKMIMITAIPLFCLSWGIFGVALALKSVNVDMDGMFNYTPPDFIFTPIDGTSNCSVKLANTNITTANIPETATISGTTYTVTEIEASGFAGTSITSVNIPTSIISIGINAFSSCSDLTSATFENKNYWIANEQVLDLSNENQRATYLKSTYTDYTWTWKEVASSENYQNLTFTPISGTTNCSVSTANTNITAANIPEKVIISDKTYTVTEVESYAFYGCTSLTSITIPASVIRIYDGGHINTDYSNYVLDTVIFEDSSNWLVVGNYYYEVTMERIPVCEYFSSSQLSDTSTASTLLKRYSSLTYDYQSYNWSRELSFAFNTSSKTASVASTKDSDNNRIAYGALEIPSQVTYNEETYTVTSIEAEGFANCNITSITIPTSVTSIGDYAFNGCASLTNITIPSSVTSIGAYAFSSCTNLSSATFASTNYWVANEQVLDLSSESQNATYLKSTYASYAWTWEKNHPNLTFTPISGTTNCSVKVANTDITTANIPETATISGETYTVTKIESEAFMGCKSLTSITIPASVVEVKERAFSSCTQLEEVKCYAKKIYSYAFTGCSNLATVYLHNTTFIGAYAFNNCSVLSHESVYGLSDSTWYRNAGQNGTTWTEIQNLDDNNAPIYLAINYRHCDWATNPTSYCFNDSISDGCIGQINGKTVMEYDIDNWVLTDYGETSCYIKSITMSGGYSGSYMTIYVEEDGCNMSDIDFYYFGGFAVYDVYEGGYNTEQDYIFLIDGDDYYIDRTKIQEGDRISINDDSTVYEYTSSEGWQLLKGSEYSWTINKYEYWITVPGCQVFAYKIRYALSYYVSINP